MVRLLALPRESPTWAVLLEQQEKADQRRKVADLDDILARFKP
jgi:hypothetical protein